MSLFTNISSRLTGSNSVTATIKNMIAPKSDKAPDAFFFCLRRKSVQSLELSEETFALMAEKGISMQFNSKGLLVQVNQIHPGYPVWLNGAVMEIRRDYYLKHEDVIALQSLDPEDTEFYIYTVFNQMDSRWMYTEIDIPSVFGDVSGVEAFETVVLDARHLLFDGKGYYVQETVTKAQQEVLPLLAKQLGPDMCLDIDIRRRFGGTGTGKKLLLENIQLKLKPGEMVLVLGGSGAGKTTFFNTVMGTEKGDATILLGGQDYYRNYEKMKQMVGYVRQNNVLRDNDTVYMTLDSLARTRLPKELTANPDLLDMLIRNVLCELSIENESDTLVGKLSGGQKRRLSIAAEYVYAPPLFFLDEPDSGLDPVTAKALMATLRTIADKGKIVIVITHTPDRTPDYFDKVLVLAKNSAECGKMAFFGTVEETLRFFETDSFEGVEDLINHKPDYYIEKYEKESMYDE